jgi:glycosyltransferase involved in cell wall biosynthesis
MPLATDNLSAKAMGGSEIMKYKLIERLPKELTDQFQIFVSRIQEPLNPDLIKIYWHQDLPEDPNAIEPLKNNGWKNFDMLVFNSSWQQTVFQRAFNIPHWKSTVLCNAIDPFERTEKPDPSENVNIIYHTTPHRGLELLVPVFERLADDDKNITLDVYSSFSMYGWSERDAQYQELFDRCKDHSQINYHGYQKNDVIRKALINAHIYAYPSIWTESSCISLMEAMSASVLCVHSNLGALWDTGGGLTRMYPFDEDANIHANRFAILLKDAIDSVRTKNINAELMFVKSYADIRFNWDRRQREWSSLMESLVAQKKAGTLKNRNDGRFIYRT